MTEETATERGPEEAPPAEVLSAASSGLDVPFELDEGLTVQDAGGTIRVFDKTDGYVTGYEFKKAALLDSPELQRLVGERLAPARPQNVIEALARCILEMPAVGKDKEMNARDGGGSGYKYRSIEGVTSHASTLFGRYVVVIKPHKIRRTVEPLVLNGKPWTIDLLKVKYRIYGPGGVKDFIDTAWFHALARDNSDKGTNKAMTQAYKQCLLQLLVVGDNKDDPDTYSPQSDGSAPEAAAEPEQLTPDEWALRNGWDSDAERRAAGRRVQRAIKRLAEEGKIDPGAAEGMWEDYKRPPWLQQTQPGQMGARRHIEHKAWWDEHMGDAPDEDSPEEAAAAQAAAEASQDPASGQPATPPPSQPSPPLPPLPQPSPASQPSEALL